MPDLDTPDTWRAGFARLSPTVLPCPGLRPDEWYALHPLAKAFLEECAEEVYDKGWRGLDLFGVHPVVGTANLALCGALVMGPSDPPGKITTESIVFGRTRYYRRPLVGAVLVWEFGD